MKRASPFELAGFIEACRSAQRSADPSLEVERLMSQALAKPKVMAAALGAGEPASGHSADYVFLHQSAELTVLKVAMPGKLRSPPHNHFTWAVVGMYAGEEDNVFYRREGSRIVESGRRRLVAPQAMRLARDTIHGIANPLPRPSHALHVYGASLANPARSLWNPFTLEEEPFQVPAMLAYERELMRRQNPNGT